MKTIKTIIAASIAIILAFVAMTIIFKVLGFFFKLALVIGVAVVVALPLYVIIKKKFLR